MLMALEPEARREMSNLLYRQHYDQRRHDRLFESRSLSDVEQAAGQRAARSGFGTGGGRARRIPVEPS